jgi:hypothetical protein
VHHAPDGESHRVFSSVDPYPLSISSLQLPYFIGQADLIDELLFLYMWEINHSSMTEHARPLGVTIIGILWILAGLLTAVGAGLGGATLAVIGLGALGAMVGVVFVIIGLVFIALGIGCFKGWPWVWPVGVIFTIIGLVINLLSILSNTGAAIIGIIIDIIILWYLFQPQVKAWFRVG